MVIEIASSDGSEPPQRREVTTTGSGDFSALFALPVRRYTVSARFPGDDHHRGSSARREIDLAKSDVLLQFEQPQSHSFALDDTALEVLVRASSAAGGQNLAIALHDERGHLLAQGASGPGGLFGATITSAMLGPAGLGALRVESSADARRNASSSTRALVRTLASQLTLEQMDTAAAQGVQLAGALRSARGGLPGEPIGIFHAEQHLASVETDAQGRYSLRVEVPDTAGADGAELHARFDSPLPWIRSSRSSTLRIAPKDDGTPSPAWLLLPSLLCAIAIGWGLRRRAGKQPQAVADEADGAILAAGIHREALTDANSTDRQRLKGELRSADLGAALEQASVRISPRRGDDLIVECDASGRFETPSLPSGRVQLELRGADHLTLSAEISLPQSGAGSFLRVRLPSLRSAALQAYKPAALVVLPRPELWETSTAREVLHHAAQLRTDTPRLAALVEQVERAGYGVAAPKRRDIETIAADARSVLRTASGATVDAESGNAAGPEAPKGDEPRPPR